MKKILIVITLLVTSLSFAQQNEQQSLKQSNLSMLQPITVTVGGDFIVNGSFPAVKSERLDQFITTLYTEAQQRALSSLNQLETIKQVEKEISRYALRDITLKRSNGEVVIIDLLKFRLTADFKFNPYLMNDDVIIFPSYDNDRNIVDINGAVNKPTKFQFVEGDNLSDAILFAGGINAAYDNIKTAEISRLNSSGDKEEIISIDINSNFPLKYGDRIRIMADQNQKKVFKALVLGEVKNPGYVYLKQNGSLLGEVIQKAGGFTSNADLTRSEVIRNYNAVEMLKKYQLTEDYLNSPDKLLLPETQLKMQQMQDALTLLRTNNLQLEDTLFFNIDNQLRVLRGESLVDFTKLSDPQSDESNFIVRDGDMVIVPQPFNYVYVFGQVSKFGYVKHAEGKNYKYYVEKAGGKTEMAREDDDEIVVIKGKGKAWITEDKEKLKIEPGDYVFVPKIIPRNFNYYLSRVSGIAGTIGSVATIILLLIQFGK
ncbi:MAG: SLBB domain-containing protein [Ignavibacteriales bacterium]|nr:SLBB domain-containing protein [Ignavibacteriales bacterium]